MIKKRGFIVLLLVGLAGFIIPVMLYECSFKGSYTLLEKPLELNNNVRKLHFDRGSSFIGLDDGRSIRVLCSKNSNYETPFFSSIIERGDRIIKQVNSDSIVVVKPTGEEYSFLHGNCSAVFRQGGTN